MAMEVGLSFFEIELSMSPLREAVSRPQEVDIDLCLESLERPRRMDRLERTEVSREESSSLSRSLLTYMMLCYT